MADNWTAYEQPVRDEINVPYGDDERVRRAIQAAIGYVNGALGGQTVGQEVMTDCVTSCATDLYNSRDARLGVMSVGGDVKSKNTNDFSFPATNVAHAPYTNSVSE